MRDTIVVPTREIAAKDRNNFLLLGDQSSSHGRFVGTGPQRGRPLEDADLNMLSVIVNNTRIPICPQLPSQRL